MREICEKDFEKFKSYLNSRRFEDAKSFIEDYTELG